MSRVVADITRDFAELEARVTQAAQQVAQAEALRRRAEKQLKTVADAGKYENHKMARQMIEAATALMVTGIAIYIADAEDPQFARQKVQSYLAARLVPVLGAPIPEHPWGPDAEL